MEMTLADAAKATKRTKQALSQAVNKGKLSAAKDANGVWKVDSAELFRVYPPENKPLQQEPGNDLELLRSRLAALEALHEADRELISELRRARDAWQAQAERLALTASPTATSTTAEKAEIRPVETVSAGSQGEGHGEDDKPGKRGFLARFFGWGGE